MTDATTPADMRVCANDGEPLVWTFEFRGAEYYCVVCHGHEDTFGCRAPATADLQLRHTELREQYERARAERRGVPYEPDPKAGDAGVDVPTCSSCGATPEPGVALVDGKPPAWFSRTRDGVTEFACSRSCIPEKEAILPW